MPFKEDATTNNIYKSWFDTIHFSMIRGIPNWRGLIDFTEEELNHLKWLIEQELEVRKVHNNGDKND